MADNTQTYLQELEKMQGVALPQTSFRTVDINQPKYINPDYKDGKPVTEEYVDMVGGKLPKASKALDAQLREQGLVPASEVFGTNASWNVYIDPSAKEYVDFVKTVYPTFTDEQAQNLSAQLLNNNRGQETIDVYNKRVGSLMRQAGVEGAPPTNIGQEALGISPIPLEQLTEEQRASLPEGWTLDTSGKLTPLKGLSSTEQTQARGFGTGQPTGYFGTLGGDNQSASGGTGGTTGETTGGTTGSTTGGAEGTTSLEEQGNLAAQDVINNSNLPQELKDMLTFMTQQYEGTTVDTQEILKTFDKMKAETIDPYYASFIDLTKRGFQAAQEQLETNRALELEQERATSGQRIQQAQAGLEQSGMTFTGKGVEQLGAQSAYPQASTEGEIPTQQTYGGLFYEGEVPQANRLMATSSAARYKTGLEQLGQSIEQQLGTSALSQFGLTPTTTTPFQGNIATEKQSKEASTLSDLIGQYYEKQQLNRIENL